ncbi:hypothetical protein GCM10022396_34430 [Flavivirga amylovorans]
MSGLGIWLPASIPQVTIFNDQWILNQEYFIKFIGYFVLIFEIIFPFVFFIKKLRPYFLFIGVALHIGIFFEFPIPYFALGYIAIYLLMISVGLWQIIMKKVQYKKPRLQLFYNSECQFCLRVKICISHFDVFKAIEFIPIQEHTSKEILSNTFYVVNNKGEQFVGNAAYKKVIVLIPFFYPIALLAYLPGTFKLIKFLFGLVFGITKSKKSVKLSNNLENNKKKISDNDILFKKISYKSFKIKTAKILFIALLFFQFNVVFNFPFSENIVKSAVKINPSLEKPIKKLKNYKNILNKNVKRFFGITGHGVFVDSHYIGFDKIFNISYKGEFLPLYDEQGMPGYYLKGGIWANYNFRVNKPYVLDNPEKLKEGLIRYASFWAHKNEVNLNTAEFSIHMKKINLTFEWEENFLKENLSNPWEEVGTMTWKDKKAIVTLKHID